MSRYKSDIPENTVERSVSPYREEDGRVSHEEREYTVDGDVVGYRYYDADGALALETPIRDGLKHGVEYYWYEPGCLTLAAPYENGLPHGTARQWADDGTLMGTYTLVHGTGYDLWRQQLGDGPLHISEIHSMKDGSPHGYEWWVNEDESSVWHEVHWREGRRHGIERMWDHEGNLDEGYPKFHVEDAVVGKETYIERQKTDGSLPPYAEIDDRNTRRFPDEVVAAIDKTRSSNRGPA